jgi:hypothetical protein
VDHHTYQKIWVGRDKKVTRLETEQELKGGKENNDENSLSSKILKRFQI